MKKTGPSTKKEVHFRSLDSQKQNATILTIQKQNERDSPNQPPGHLNLSSVHLSDAREGALGQARWGTWEEREDEEKLPEASYFEHRK